MRPELKSGKTLWTGKHTKIVMPKEEVRAPSSCDLLLDACIFAGTFTWTAMKAVTTVAAFLLSWFFLYAVFSVAFGSYSSSGSEIQTAQAEKIAELDIRASQATEQRYEQSTEVLVANLEAKLVATQQRMLMDNQQEMNNYKQAVNKEIAKIEQRSKKQIQLLQKIQGEILAEVAEMKQRKEEKKMIERGDHRPIRQNDVHFVKA